MLEVAKYQILYLLGWIIAEVSVYIWILILKIECILKECTFERGMSKISSVDPIQSRVIGAVRGAHSQLWGTIIPVCSLYAAHKYDKRFGTPAIVWFTGRN